MSIQKLPSGRYRATILNPESRQRISVAKVLGGRGSFRNKTEARAALREAEQALAAKKPGDVTVWDWFTTWTTDALYAPPKQSTRLHNTERVKHFCTEHAGLRLSEVTDMTVARWLAGGKRNGQVPALRAMFNAAASAKAGRLIDANPWAGLGIARTKGNEGVDPPSTDTVHALAAAAGRVCGPSLRAWLLCAMYVGMRPGELDALRWGAVDFKADRVSVDEQFSTKTRTFTLPKNGLRRVAPLTPPARAALLELADEGVSVQADPRAFVFPALRAAHWTASSRAYHWKATRAQVGYEDTLYLATRHYCGWYMTNELELDSETVAIALGHTDGGELVRRLYGHRDRNRALSRVIEAAAEHSKVVSLAARRALKEAEEA